MKKQDIVRLVLLVTPILVWFSGCVGIQGPDGSATCGKAGRPLIVAHRGAGDLVMPEASKSAYSNAVATACDIVKLDLQSTRDGVIVMSHDPTLKRTMGWNTNISQVAYGDILSNHVFIAKGRYANERIVRLDEALAIVKTVPEFWIDFKHFRPEFAERVLKAMDEAGIDESRIMSATFSYGALEYLRKTHPRVRRVAHVSMNAGTNGTWRVSIAKGQTFPDKSAALRAILAARDRMGLFGVNMPVLGGETTPEDADFLRANGLWVSLWFVQDAAKAARYRDHADAFVSDHKGRLGLEAVNATGSAR